MCLAVPAEIVKIKGEEPLARTADVSINGVIQEISIAYVPEAKVGDYVIIHAGFALNILDKDEAEQLLQDIKKIDEFNSSIEV